MASLQRDREGSRLARRRAVGPPASAPNTPRPAAGWRSRAGGAGTPASVKAHRLVQRVQSIQPHEGVAQRRRLAHHSRCQETPQPPTAIRRSDKQPFHFANAFLFQRAQRHTARRVRPIPRQQQPIPRRRVAARQGDEFFREALKIQIDAQEPLIIAEQRPRGCDVVLRSGRNEVHGSRPAEADCEFWNESADFFPRFWRLTRYGFWLEDGRILSVRPGTAAGRLTRDGG